MRRPWDSHPYQFARQNPVVFKDPDGRAVNLFSGGVGLVAGGVLGGAAEMAREMYYHEAVNVRAIGASALGGSIAGGAAGLTLGASLMVEAGGTAFGGAVGGIATRGLNGEANTARAVATDAAIGIVTIGAGKAIPHVLFGQAAKGIATPYEIAKQSWKLPALSARSEIAAGATMYRVGTLGKSGAVEAQFWALEHPHSSGYAARYGIPPENVANADFIEKAALKSGTPFVTRTAPPVGTNPGGGIEVVVPERGVTMQNFTMP